MLPQAHGYTRCFFCSLTMQLLQHCYKIINALLLVMLSVRSFTA